MQISPFVIPQHYRSYNTEILRGQGKPETYKQNTSH